MTGACSRARRKDAVNRARDDVYARKGKPMAYQPFTCARQARIYKESYSGFREMYWRMEALRVELEQVYGGCE